MAAAAPTPVAYEDPSDNYERRVRRLLEKMGSKDPEGDVASMGDYVVRARDAEIDPQVVASQVWMTVHVNEAPAPGSRFGRTSAWGAEERPSRPGYYAVDPTGKIIAGPFTERRFAEPHSSRVNGYIQFEPGEPIEPVKLVAAAEKVAGAAAGAADCAHGHPPEVPVRPCGGSGAADCGCGRLHPPGPPPEVIVLIAEEAYKKELHWHKDPKKEQRYTAEAGSLGKFTVERRTPDRRHGVLEWKLTLGPGRGDAGRLVRELHGSKKWQGFQTKSDAQKYAARYARKPMLPSAGEAAAAPSATEPPPAGPSNCIAVVERSPGCAVPGRVIEDAEDVYELLQERQKRQGHETYEVLLLNLNDELIGSPVQVASGQRSKVNVDIEQVLAPVVLKEAVKGAEAGCVSFYAVHFHPSGSAEGSPKDKELTKLIEAGAKAACPSTTFKDHLVLGYKEVYSCKKGKIVYRAP